MDFFKLGLLSGISFALIILLIVMLVKKKKTLKDYDERQQMVRGKAFKYGFFTFLGMDFLFSLINLVEINIFERGIEQFVSIFVAVTVFGVYSTLNGAYFGLNESKKNIIVCDAILMISQVIIGIPRIIDGEVIVDGVITIRVLSILCAFMFLALFVALIISENKAKKEAEDEE